MKRAALVVVALVLVSLVAQAQQNDPLAVRVWRMVRTIADCDGSTSKVIYSAESRTFSCATEAGGGGVSDGDKGDVTVSGSGASWLVDALAVAFSDLSGTASDAQVDGSLEADEVNPILGTQTQGNFVASVATTAPLTGGAAGSEGGILTLGLNQNLGTNVADDLEEETHASEHQHGGLDEIGSAAFGANVIVKAGATGTIDQLFIPTLFATDAEALAAFIEFSDMNDLGEWDTLVGLSGVPADDWVFVADSATTGTWRQMPDCGESGTLNYTAASNTFSCLTDASGGGGGNSVEVSLALSGGAGFFSTTVTGQAWVALGSEIVCSPLGTTADSLTPEAISIGGLSLSVSGRVAGDGFNLNVYSPNGLEGTVRVHCIGV